ncbi:tripartite tricarboxylate transporter substrate binding protein [Bordetella sp. BOR01]|uniref:Bug family tripartite tricarboxylate transporter substrate binding protein n=1 Tax=Bordetella sp. BOR01 TaxID=2854779 RepID=UPI001C479762|nr:tripartite tricarboxylate transporter substrate binding protein [Bordetella sp. BOR01]
MSSLAFAVCAGHASAGAAETFPSKPIRIIVPWTAGGFTDILARRLAEHMSGTLGQPVIVENKVGASGSIGATYVSKAAPDCYTILMETPDTMVINPMIMKDLAYDPVKSFDQISLLVVQPMVLSSSGKSNFKSLPDLIERARSSKNPMTYGSWGNASAAHLAFAQFADLTDVQMTHIPYKGVSEAFTDVIAGRVDVIFVGMMSSKEYVANGQLRPLAIADDQRSRALPDLPTFKELGIDMPNLSLWYAFGAPAGTPPAAMKRLQEAASAALKDPAINSWLTGYGMSVVSADPDTASQFIKDEIPRWSRALKAAKVANISGD